MKNIFISLFFFLLNSCGTFLQREHVVQIDTEPRNAKVFHKDKHIGNTPLFYKFSKKRHNKFSINSGENKDEFEDIFMNCSFNWSDSVIPNLIFSISGPLLPIGFLAIDHYSGGLYKCPKKLFVKVDSIKEIIKVKKRRVLMIPPFSQNYKLSYTILRLYKKRIKQFDIVDIDKGNLELSFHGINNDKKWNIENIQDHIRLQVGHELGITHFMFFELDHQDKNKLVVKAKLFDAFTKEKRPDESLNNVKIKFKSNNEKYNLLERIYYDAFRFLPNSLTASYSGNSSVFIETQDEALDLGEHPRRFPRMIRTLGFGYILHPRLFRRWDFNLSLTPGLSFHGGSYNQSFFDAKYAFYEAGLTLFTPFGFVFAGFGLGPSYFRIDDNLGHSFSGTRLLGKFELYYALYITDRYFLKFSTRILNVDSEGWNDPSLQLSGFSEYSLSVGYYYPELKNLMKRLF